MWISLATWQRASQWSRRDPETEGSGRKDQAHRVKPVRLHSSVNARGPVLDQVDIRKERRRIVGVIHQRDDPASGPDGSQIRDERRRIRNVRINDHQIDHNPQLGDQAVRSGDTDCRQGVIAGTVQCVPQPKGESQVVFYDDDGLGHFFQLSYASNRRTINGVVNIINSLSPG